MEKTKWLFMLLCILLILLMFLFMLLMLPARHALADTLRVDYYDMGKADAMLITTAEGAHILIDTGTNKGGKELVKRFAEEGITHIDLMLITHYDKDHVGGADKILENLTVDAVVMPQYHKESKQYNQFVKALSSSPQTSVTHMDAGQILEMTFGTSALRLSAALKTDYGRDEENDFSIAARLTYGRTRFFFTGDAEDARQAELLAEGDTACDVLKVPYHGRLGSMSDAFLSACSPQIAFITDSAEEPASTEVIRLLKQTGAAVYCAKDGGITVVSDGACVAVQ